MAKTASDTGVRVIHVNNATLPGGLHREQKKPYWDLEEVVPAILYA